MLQILKGIEAAKTRKRPARPADRQDRAVLKFGSSVLRDHHDLSRVAGEIYRQSLRYRQLFVVVSAFGGQTDQLLARFELVAGSTDCSGCADLVSIGEELTAAQLVTACSRIGLEAFMLRPEQWAIDARGDSLDATPTSLPSLPSFVPGEGVIIIPGFVGLNEFGERVLLGRGGSDFSAIFLGGELKADCVRLYKDVDGVYDHDPATGGEAFRFDEISWSACLDIARPLLQPNAIEYAQAKALPLEVGTIGTSSPTRVCQATTIAQSAKRQRPLNIGLAGFGVVGQALYLRLLRESDFNVSAILVRNRDKKRDIYPPFELTDCLETFCNGDFDVVVDATCGEEAGFPLTSAQLERGGAVVSANKTVIEPWFEEFTRLSQRRSGFLGLSACVGGGTPILEAVGNCAERGITRISAVLNGTVNFLLDQLAQGHSFELALSRAQRAGFAEEDPSQDLIGADAEIKLRLIARKAFGCALNNLIIRKEGLTPARIRKFQSSPDRWIQLASLERAADCVVGSIGFVRASSIETLPPLHAERNFARLTLVDGTNVQVVGRGAGGAPTAEAVMTDLFALKQQLDGCQSGQRKSTRRNS